MQDKELEDIIEDIRELRDADYHVCPHSEWQSKGEPNTTDDIECTCNHFDHVIDKVRKFLSPKSIEKMWDKMKKKYKNIKMEKGTSERANEQASNEQLHQINTNLFCNYKQEINEQASEQ